MTFTKWEARLVYLLCFIIGLIWSVQLTTDQNTGQHNTQHNEDGWILGWSPDQWIAILTLVITVATIVQIFLWRRANKTADNALEEARASVKLTQAATEQTKRSVDAYVHSERARIRVSNVTESISDGKRELHFVIESIGRGLATITGEWLAVTYIGEGDVPIIDKASILENIYVPLAPGEVIQTRKPDSSLGVTMRLPVPMEEPPEGTKHIIFRILLRYEAWESVTYLSGTTWVMKKEDGLARRVHKADYSFDVPWQP